MNRMVRLLHSSIGCKVTMAATGIGLLLFVIGHLLGNLKIFQGAESLNAYAVLLRETGPLLWIARIGLITIFLLHIYCAFRLHTLNREARPVTYYRHEFQRANFAGRHMLLSGLVVLAFVIYHLLHFTFRVVGTGEMNAHDAAGNHDVYRMLYTNFQNGWVAVSYIVAMLLLGLHLAHGSASIFQTLGLRHVGLTALINWGAGILTALLILGNCAIPIAVFFELIPLASGG